jgi:DNA-binding NtrC family response regulator
MQILLLGFVLKQPQETIMEKVVAAGHMPIANGAAQITHVKQDIRNPGIKIILCDPGEPTLDRLTWLQQVEQAAEGIPLLIYTDQSEAWVRLCGDGNFEVSIVSADDPSFKEVVNSVLETKKQAA